jgi:hypothetical protein
MIVYDISHDVEKYRMMMLTGGDAFSFPMYERLEQSDVSDWVVPRYVPDDDESSKKISDLVAAIGALVLQKSAARVLADQLRGCQILSVECEGADCVLINPPRVDCLDLSKCKFRMSPDGNIQEIMAGFVEPSRVTVPLFRPYDKRGFNMSYFLCTEEFKQAVEHAKLTGFKFRDISTRREWFKF